jgi:hypothetical protein
MRNTFAYLLPLIGLVSWQCGGGGMQARYDAATDPVPATLPDGLADAPADARQNGGPDVLVGQPDASDVRATDTGDTTPSSGIVLDGGSERGGNDATIDKSGPDDRGRAPEVSADLKVDTADAEVPPVDAVPPDVRRDGGSDSRGQCNDLTPGGTPHDVVGVDGAPPPPLGGTIEDGVYHETAAQVFGSTSGNPLVGTQRRMTLVIAGSLMQAAFTSSADGEVQSETDQMSTSPEGDPSAMAVKQLCPGSAPTTDFVFHYSFVGTGPGATFTIIYPSSLTGSSWTSVLTLVKQ